jgi:hypothetical protein
MFYADCLDVLAAAMRDGSTPRQVAVAIAALVQPEPTMPAPSGSDDTAALQAALATIPDGSVVSFAPDTYIIDATFTVTNRHRLTFECAGATFVATTKGDRRRAHWRFVDCTDITINDVTIVGANPNGGLAENAYNPAFEAQHGVEIIGCRNVTLNRPTITDVWGDFVYIAAGWPISQATWSDGVEVQGFTFARNGRQAVAVIAGRNINVHHGTIDAVRRSVLDIEPNLPGVVQGCRNLSFSDNTIGDFRLTFFACRGAGGDIGDVTVTRNRLHGNRAAMKVTIVGPPSAARRGPIALVDNTAEAGIGSGGDAVAMYLYRCDGVTVTGNTQPLQPGRNMALVGLNDCTSVTVVGNTVPGGIESRTIV